MRRQGSVLQGETSGLCSEEALAESLLSSREKEEEEEAPGAGARRSTLPDGSLRLSGAEKEDAGEYLCLAVNTEGKADLTAVLAVRGTHTREHTHSRTHTHVHTRTHTNTHVHMQGRMQKQYTQTFR